MKSDIFDGERYLSEDRGESEENKSKKKSADSLANMQMFRKKLLQNEFFSWQNFVEKNPGKYRLSQESYEENQPDFLVQVHSQVGIIDESGASSEIKFMPFIKQMRLEDFIEYYQERLWMILGKSEDEDVSYDEVFELLDDKGHIDVFDMGVEEGHVGVDDLVGATLTDFDGIAQNIYINDADDIEYDDEE